jgi:DNA-directed RNA polymerase subunit beta'
VIITEEDCGTIRGLETEALKEGEEIIQDLSDRIEGRVTADDIYDPVTNDLLIEAGTMIDEDLAERIENAGIDSVKIRSVLTCETRRGVCQQCYGRNLSTGREVDIGEAVGVVAAQSIGEPGTQLTLRTFHVGGIAGRVAEKAQRVAPCDATLEFVNGRAPTRSPWSSGTRARSS